MSSIRMASSSTLPFARKPFRPVNLMELALGRMIALNNPAVAVLFMTGRRDLIEIAGGIPSEVLYKPIELNELANKVGALLAEKPSQQEFSGIA
jgi:DNA-binding response OmpR family regulator